MTNAPFPQSKIQIPVPNAPFPQSKIQNPKSKILPPYFANGNSNRLK
jgi:hypothetical protein